MVKLETGHMGSKVVFTKKLLFLRETARGPVSFLVLWFKGYRLCRQRALYSSLFLDSLLKITN